MYVLVDVGGSGIKMASFSKGKIGKTTIYHDIKNYETFISKMKEQAKSEKLEGVAISSAGFVNAEEGKIIRCEQASFLEGEIVKRIRHSFPWTKVKLVNDGEAHTRALLVPNRNVKFGAIHLALGTSVAFGVINAKGEIVRACDGNNWDIGDFALNTREAPRDVYYKLGSKGLAELENNLEEDPYLHFGYRLGSFLRNLAVIFRPRTIGLSGGIISAHSNEIIKGVEKEFWEPVNMDSFDFHIFSDENTVMEGLTTLL